MLLCTETLCMEMRERMSHCPYWYILHRRAKKIIGNASIILKELVEQVWVWYGLALYYSPEAEGCSEKNETYIWCMGFFLILGCIKMVCFALIVIVAILYVVLRKHRRGQERNRSLEIVRGLSNVKFSALIN